MWWTGYGLLISVLADHKEDFNRLEAFYRAHTTVQGLMIWCQTQDPATGVISDIYPRDGPEAIYKSAVDGDLDVAYALLLAGEAFLSRSSSQRFTY